MLGGVLDWLDLVLLLMMMMGGGGGLVGGLGAGGMRLIWVVDADAGIGRGC